MNFRIYDWYEDLPDENIDIYEENLKLFFKTMFERQEIWYRRFIKKEDYPWTDDEILKKSKFTNVYRELDRSSQFQIKNIIKNESEDKIDLVWQAMFYRFLNSPDFFQWLSDRNKFDGRIIPKRKEYDPDYFWRCMQEYRSVGKNPFTNAYLINSMACPGMKRDKCYSNVVLQSLKERLLELFYNFKKARRPEDIIKRLKTLPSVADFIAHEFYQDFTYFPRYNNFNVMKFDQNDFTNVGPGAAVGIRLIFPSLKDQKSGIYHLRDLAKSELKDIGFFKFLEYDKTEKRYFISNNCNITLHQIEMWLCEFQKYWKMKIGKGKQRSEFKPKTKNK